MQVWTDVESEGSGEEQRDSSDMGWWNGQLEEAEGRGAAVSEASGLWDQMNGNSVDENQV